MKKVYFSLFAAFATFVVSAQTKVEIDGIWYNLYSETEQAQVTHEYDSYQDEYSITIPATVTNEGVEYIVTSIGAETFYNCRSLTTINIPEGVTSIGAEAFYNCRSLTTINIPEGVTSIEDWTFYNCSSLTSIIIPEGVTSIGERAFDGCYSLTAITIPEGVTGIGDWAFSQCEKLTAITIPEGVTSIEDNTFLNCYSLTAITIPEGVTSIGCYAFADCYSLTDITIPEGVTSIGDGAFSGCHILTAITIPEGVTSIGDFTFYNCYKLTTITIPEGVTSIGYEAFSGCTKLQEVTCKALTPPSMQSDAFYNIASKAKLYVSGKSINNYQNASYWSNFSSIEAYDVLILKDSQDNFTKDENEEYCSINYTRNFTNTAWQSLYVPFEIHVTDELLEDFEIADLNDIRQYDRNDDGVKDETVVEAFKVKSGATLAANYPYLIRAKEAGEKTIAVTDATLFAAEEVSIDCSSIREKFTFTGTYSRKGANELGGCYALCDGVWQPLAADAALGAFRVHLKIENRNSNTASARAIRIHVVGEDDTTDIDELESNANAQQSVVVHDLQGRRIMNVDDFKGVYIVNGKKVVK